MTSGHSHIALGLYLIEKELASDAASLVLPKRINSHSQIKS